jgi:hypothetical protein
VCGRLQFVADGHSWFQVIEDGEIADWRRGRLADADAEVEVRWSIADAARILARQIDGTNAFAVTTICVRGERPYTGPLPPLDLFELPELAEVPPIPGADVSLMVLLRKAPFGDVTYYQRFVDGLLHATCFGGIDQPDVYLETPFGHLVRQRHQELTMLEALESSKVSGSPGPLMVMAGILEREQWQRVQLATPRDAHLALAALGEVGSEPAYQQALAQLMAETELP